MQFKKSNFLQKQHPQDQYRLTYTQLGLFGVNRSQFPLLLLIICLRTLPVLELAVDYLESNPQVFEHSIQ